MQALSVWPSRGGFGAVPQLYFEVGSSSYLSNSTRNRRRKRWDLVESCCVSRNNGFLSVSNSLRFSCSGACWRSIRFDSKYGFSCLKLFIFSGLRRGSFDASVVVTCAMKHQEIGNHELLIAESNSIDGLSGESEMVNVDHPSLDIVEDNDEYNGKEESDEIDIKCEGNFGMQENNMVDVRVLSQSLWSAKTADDVEEVLKDMGQLRPQVHSTMIRVFGKEKRMECAMALFEWLKRKKKETGGIIGPNLFVYNSLLRAVKHTQQFGELEKIMNDMAKEGVHFNIVTYNTLMAIYLEQGEATKALNFLEVIQKKGFTPSRVSYSQALMAYRRMEDGNGALNFFVEIRDKYLKGEIGKDTNEDWANEFVKLENIITRICYQVMRRSLVKDENLSINVLKLLTEMDKARLQLCRAEYERLVWACTHYARDEHYVVAKELYTRIRERHSDISLSVCNHLIRLMGKAKKWSAALEIYGDLLDKGPNPDNKSYDTIVSHFNKRLSEASKIGDWKWGVHLLNQMEDKGLEPGSREWNAVLVACSNASDYSATVEIFKRMVDKGEKPTIISYVSLLSAFEKSKLYNEALRVWQHMLNVGVKPNVCAYTIMASVFTAQGKFDMVELIFQDMAQSGYELTVVTYNSIISACARNSMSNAAYEWFLRMRVQSIPPNKITYEMLIEALAKDGKPRLAYELYLEAQAAKLNLSVKAYGAVVESSEACEATIDLTLLGPRPPE